MSISIGDTVWFYWDGRRGEVVGYGLDPCNYTVLWDNRKQEHPAEYAEWELRAEPGIGGRW